MSSNFLLGDTVKVIDPEKYMNRFRLIFENQIGFVIGFCSVNHDQMLRVCVSFKEQDPCDCYCEYLFMEHDLEKVRAENV